MDTLQNLVQVVASNKYLKTTLMVVVNIKMRYSGKMPFVIMDSYKDKPILDRQDIIYCRVSTNKQKNDLSRQVMDVINYCNIKQEIFK